MAEQIKVDEREQEILRRMTESRGALNRQQAELAVDLQAADDALKEKEAKASAKKKKVTEETPPTQ